MHTPRSTSLPALATLPWPLFIACSVLMLLVWLSGFGAGMLADPNFARWLPNDDLRAALAVFSRTLDPIWATLGAVNAYLALVRTEGLASARRWSALVLATTFGIAAASVLTALPLGPIHFPANLGMKIGPVPFAFPFLWLLIIAGARDTVLRAFPRLGHAPCAMLTGALCALTSLLLDPLAWKYRAWWLWYPALLDAPDTAPWSAHLTWLLAGSALAFILRPKNVAPRAALPLPIPMIGYVILNVAITLTRLVR